MSRYYHFNIGDSDTGPLGMCAIIKAKNKTQAVERLKDLVPEIITIISRELGKGEYINVYFGRDHFKQTNIDSVER